MPLAVYVLLVPGVLELVQDMSTRVIAVILVRVIRLLVAHEVQV